MHLILDTMGGFPSFPLLHSTGWFIDVLGLEVGAGTPEGGGEEQEDKKCT